MRNPPQLVPSGRPDAFERGRLFGGLVRQVCQCLKQSHGDLKQTATLFFEVIEAPTELLRPVDDHLSSMRSE